MKVHIRNEEPMWVRYGLVAEVPDELASAPDAEIAEVALSLVGEGKYEIDSGPDPRDTISGMDQIFMVEAIDR